MSSLRNFDKVPTWCRKPQSFTYHLCAEDISRAELVNALSKEERKILLEDGVLPHESSAKGQTCVMCPVRIPCCLCENWCRVGRSNQTHLGRACPCHIRILNPKRKIMFLSHPYVEDSVVLPTRSGIRSETRLAGRDLSAKKCVALLDKASAQWRQGFELVYQMHSFGPHKRLSHKCWRIHKLSRLSRSARTVHDTPPSRLLCHLRKATRN